MFSVFLEIIKIQRSYLLCWQEFRNVSFTVDFRTGEILNNMAELINLYESDEEALKAKEDQFFKSINGLVETGGNVWIFRKYMAYISYISSGKSRECLQHGKRDPRGYQRQHQ